MAEGRVASGTAIESNAGAIAEENKIKHLHPPHPSSPPSPFGEGAVDLCKYLMGRGE
jgi:hypothetical protein